MKNINLEELIAQERREYFRTWRAANKEKTAKHRRRYWEKKALEKLQEGVEDNVIAEDENAGRSHETVETR